MEVPIILIAILKIWSFLLKETVGQAVTLREVLHTTAEFPCVYPDLAEPILAAQWYKSSNSSVFVNDGVALAWWYRAKTGGLQGFGITEDFALVMRNVNITDSGLYRCVVTPYGNVDDYTHDVNIDVYALPSSSPVIEYARHADGFRVTCSVNNFYPNVAPKLDLLSGSTKSDGGSVVNDDGTFNMTTTTYIPCSEEDLAVECSYSNLNYDSSSSLRTPSCSSNISGTDLNNRDPPSGLWIGWTTLGVDCVIFIAIMAISFEVPTSLLRFCSRPGAQEAVRQKDVQRMNKMSCYAALLGIAFVIIFISTVVFLAIT